MIDWLSNVLFRIERCDIKLKHAKGTDGKTKPRESKISFLKSTSLKVRERKKPGRIENVIGPNRAPYGKSEKLIKNLKDI